MNELSQIDKTLLEGLKQKIEQLSGLSGKGDLTQKDFDFLLFYIEETTGQALSLTTLKRIWRNEYQRLPHLSTLNVLALLAEGKEWHTLKKQLLEKQTGLRISDEEMPPVAQQATAPAIGRPRTNMKMVAVLVGALMLMLFAATSWYYLSTKPAGDPAAAQFSAVPTADGRIPNSVVFSYNVTGIKANRFYIQQSWDAAKKVEVSPKNKKQTDIYYEPGYHYAKLMADKQVIKEIPVHIRYNDWYVRFRFPNSELVRVGDADLDTQGQLGLKRDYVTTRFRPTGNHFQLGYMLSRDFNVSADELGVTAYARFDSLYLPACPMVHLLIKGDRDYSWITLTNTGCESSAGLKVGGTHVDGKTNDLSLLRMDALSWQKMQVTLSGGRYRLLVNDSAVQEGKYSGLLGDLKEIDFFFNGIGNLKEIQIEDKQRHTITRQHF